MQKSFCSPPSKVWESSASTYSLCQEQAQPLPLGEKFAVAPGVAGTNLQTQGWCSKHSHKSHTGVSNFL